MARMPRTARTARMPRWLADYPDPLREVNIDLREVRFIAPRLYRMCYTGTIVHMETLFASI